MSYSKKFSLHILPQVVSLVTMVANIVNSKDKAIPCFNQVASLVIHIVLEAFATQVSQVASIGHTLAQVNRTKAA